jgi:hypothetical protein
MFVGKPEGRDHMKDLDVDGLILKRILREYSVRVWIVFNWLKVVFTDVLFGTR